MRIVVLNNHVPFARGGAELHAEGLVRALRQAGHDCELVGIPFAWYPAERLLDSILSASQLDLSSVQGQAIDLAIGLRFPAWLARHPRKVFWVIHQHRQAYDQWEDGTSDLLHHPDGPRLRGLIEAYDRSVLSAAPVFANSRTVAARLLRFCGIDAPVLYHPPPLADRLSPGPFGDYLLAPSRLEPSKRQDLILKAATRMRTPMPIVFVGPEGDVAWAREMRQRAAQQTTRGPVVFRGKVSEDELVRLYREARAVIFVPTNEDYGYVTLEAMAAGKPVITVTDSGGPLEFVRDRETGLIAMPNAEALAEACDRLATEPALAEALGLAAHRAYQGLGLSWTRVVTTLLVAAGAPERALPKSSAAFDVGFAQTSAREDRETQADKTLRATAQPSLQIRVEEDMASIDGSEEMDLRSSPPPEPEPASPALDQGKLEAEGRPNEVPPPTALDHVPFTPALAAVRKAGFLEDIAVSGDLSRPDAGYLETHRRRYEVTAAILANAAIGTPLRILDVGTGPPFPFQAYLAELFPGTELHAIAKEDCYAQTYRIRRRESGASWFTVTVASCDVERTRFPYPDGSFDLVLCLETLEHLALDPLHALREAARVLVPGGRILLTTPNLISARAMANLWRGWSPYGFGVFIPGGDVSSRHNREYTPYEVEALGRLAGFVTERLETWDVYGCEAEAWRTAPLAGSPVPPSLRGQTIFWLGRAAGAIDRTAWHGLFAHDPFAWRARMKLHEQGRNLIVTLRNEGDAVWRPGEDQAPVLVLRSRVGPELERLRTLRVSLPEPVLPGLAVDVAVPVARQGDRPHVGGRVELRGGPHGHALAWAETVFGLDGLWQLADRGASG